MLTQAQMNGSFFTEHGLTLAVAGAIERIGVSMAELQSAALHHPEQLPSVLTPARTPILARR